MICHLMTQWYRSIAGKNLCGVHITVYLSNNREICPQIMMHPVTYYLLLFYCRLLTLFMDVNERI